MASNTIKIKRYQCGGQANNGPTKQTVDNSLGKDLVKYYLKDLSVVKAWDSLKDNTDLSQRESRGYQKEMIKFHNKLLKKLMLNIPFNFYSPCSKPEVVYGYRNRETVETWRLHQ